MTRHSKRGKKSKQEIEASEYIKQQGLDASNPKLSRWIMRRAQQFATNRRYYIAHPELSDTYFGQINSEAWQAKRLRIINSASNLCCKCGAVLDIHEQTIIVRRKAFDTQDTRLLRDIPDDEFEVVCRSCGQRDKHNRTKCPDKMSDSDKLSDSPTVTF